MKKIFAIIEIGSTNTKCHIYQDEFLEQEMSITIEFKKNYISYNKVITNDLTKLCKFIKEIKNITSNIYLFGCSIFRDLSFEELNQINRLLYQKYQLKINVVSQKDEAIFTSYGCFNGFKGDICIFIGGGGSTELLFVKNNIVQKQILFDFGVVDITQKFPSLKDNFNSCTFQEVTKYIDQLIGKINTKVDLLLLAGGDHLYWYFNAEYKLQDNFLYNEENQPFLLPIDLSDEYDQNAYQRSLNEIRNHSDNPKWFDGSRAMKALTNVISHKVSAKYLIPTKINMEDGLKKMILGGKIK